MSYTCGWDGGGTKTELLCLDGGGRALAQGFAGPLNLNGASREGVVATVREAVGWMARHVPGGLDACDGLVIGAAGISNAAAAALLTEAARQAGYGGPLALRGDQEIALAGAVEGPGAVLIAGTGSIGYGRDAEGRIVRVGGWGHLIDDGGSGYAIGRDILTAVVRAADGRDAPTCLTEQVFARLGIAAVPELITWLYRPETAKRDVAALAPLLSAALAQADPAALRIAERAAEALAELVAVLWRRLGLSEGELALTGSIVDHFPSIRQGIVRRCGERFPRLRVIAPRHTPAWGAASLARMKEVFSHG